MWTWETIEREWLAGSQIAVSPPTVVDAFNRVESLLGPDWITRRRASLGIPTGPAPTLHVVTMGQRLAVLDGMTGTEYLLQKLCNDDHSASAELTGIFLLKWGAPDALCELEPEIIVSGRRPRPDFRISVPGRDWAYVEVKQPSTSEEQAEANNILAMTLAEAIKVKKSFSVEIFLRRSPSVDVEMGPSTFHGMSRWGCRDGAIHFSRGRGSGIGPIWS